MKTITIYGPGCVRCTKLAEITRELVEEEGWEAAVVKETDAARMARAGILSTPALAVGGELLFSGKVPEEEDLREILLQALGDSAQVPASPHAEVPSHAVVPSHETVPAYVAASACETEHERDGERSRQCCDVREGQLMSEHDVQGGEQGREREGSVSCSCRSGCACGQQGTASPAGWKKVVMWLVLVLVALAAIKYANRYAAAQETAEPEPQNHGGTQPQ